MSVELIFLKTICRLIHSLVSTGVFGASSPLFTLCINVPNRGCMRQPKPCFLLEFIGRPNKFSNHTFYEEEWGLLQKHMQLV